VWVAFCATLRLPTLGAARPPFGVHLPALTEKVANVKTLIGLFAIGMIAIAGHAQPQITSVVNSATFSGDIGYSSIVSIFGTGLAVAPVAAQSLPLPMKLGSTEVLFCNPNLVGANGTIPSGASPCVNAQMLYASPTQINAVVPDAGNNNENLYAVSIRVRVNGVDDQDYAANKSLTFKVVPSVPSVYKMGYDCAYPATCSGLTGQSDAIHSVQRGAVGDSVTGQLVSSANPMRAKHYYTVYLTGTGTPFVTYDGYYLHCPTTFYAMYGDDATHGVTIFPQYVGLAPGYSGFDVVNVAIPSDLLRTFTDGVNLPQCSQFSTDIKRELHLVGFWQSSFEGYKNYGDVISVPVWIKPGELDCGT